MADPDPDAGLPESSYATAAAHRVSWEVVTRLPTLATCFIWQWARRALGGGGQGKRCEQTKTSGGERDGWKMCLKQGLRHRVSGAGKVCPGFEPQRPA